MLASPHVLRIADACSTIEDAALLAATTGQSSDHIDKLMEVCWKGLGTWKEADIKVMQQQTACHATSPATQT